MLFNYNNDDKKEHADFGCNPSDPKDEEYSVPYNQSNSNNNLLGNAQAEEPNGIPVIPQKDHGGIHADIPGNLPANMAGSSTSSSFSIPPVDRFSRPGAAPVSQCDGPNVAPIEQYAPNAVPIEQCSPNTAPVDQYSSNVAPVDQYSTNTAPVEQYSTNTAHVEQYSTNAAPVEQYSTNAAPVDQYSTNAAPVDQYSTNAAHIDQHSTSAAPVEQYRPGATPFGRFDRPISASEGRLGYMQSGIPASSYTIPPTERVDISASVQGMRQDHMQINPPNPSAIPPNDRIDVPVNENIPQQQRMFGFRGYYQQNPPNTVPYSESWREPIYSQAHETVSNMYTPGICANQPYTNKRTELPQAEHRHKNRNGSVGKLLRAVCLVLVCITLSGLAAYAVTEGWFGLGSTGDKASEQAPPVVNQVVIGGTNSQRNDNLTASAIPNGAGMSAEQIYAMACNQVVGIRTEITAMGGMFGSGFGDTTTTAVSGSGFIISNDGYILTNYHVIETAYQNDLPLIVSLHDGKEYNAKVIGYEEANDVALIKVEATDLNAVLIADSNNVRVGQPVYAVGNPFGDLVYTMTEGIVSALDRIVTVEGKSISTFQFSAAVNSGNSGGPVFDANGEVIGIVSAKIMGTSVEGIGFAIPINDAIDIASKLIEHGYISGRPLMGITVNTVDRASAEYFSLVIGAHVRSVASGSAAEKAGLKVGDIITSLGDTAIDSYETLIFTMRKFKAGETTTLKIWRAGQELNLSVTFDEDLSAGQPQRAQQEQPEPDQSNRSPIPEDPYTVPGPWYYQTPEPTFPK